MNQRVGYCSPESRVETLRKSRNEDSTMPIIIYVKDPYLYGKKNCKNISCQMQSYGLRLLQCALKLKHC